MHVPQEVDLEQFDEFGNALLVRAHAQHCEHLLHREVTVVRHVVAKSESKFFTMARSSALAIHLNLNLALTSRS